jgi:hypothetical protein
MFSQLTKANSRGLGTNIFQAAKLKNGHVSQIGIRHLRFDSPKFPTRFLRKPVLPSQASDLAVAEDYSELALEEKEKSQEVLDLVNNQVSSVSSTFFPSVIVASV